MEKILVIGATGNIGWPLIENLSTKEVEIIAGVRNPNKVQENFRPFSNVQVKAFDFTDASTFATALAGVDRVFFRSSSAVSESPRGHVSFFRDSQS